MELRNFIDGKFIDSISKKNIPVTDQLKHLQDLYKSGVISGYEYENEKKKLLIK